MTANTITRTALEAADARVAGALASHCSAEAAGHFNCVHGLDDCGECSPCVDYACSVARMQEAFDALAAARSDALCAELRALLAA